MVGELAANAASLPHTPCATRSIIYASHVT